MTAISRRLLPGVSAGDRYRYRVDGTLVADPASRFQPDGPFGPSEIVDPGRFQWSDAAWRGVKLAGQVVYEMHIGTFAAKGTWLSALSQLPDVARTGVSVIEVMPVAEFPGRFGWGYDGVFPYSPYTSVRDPRRFPVIRRPRPSARPWRHSRRCLQSPRPGRLCLSYLRRGVLHEAVRERVGEALNFDGPDSGPVREYFASNAGYWIAEYHLDGLRLDATQSIHDSSANHIVAAVGENARRAAQGRDVIVVSENEPQDVRMVRRCDQGGYGLDGLWNDDFHHSAIAASPDAGRRTTRTTAGRRRS